MISTESMKGAGPAFGNSDAKICENPSVKGGLVIAREIVTQSKHIGPGPL